MSNIEPITRKDDEEYIDYFVRLFDNKNTYNLNCIQIADLLNKESGSNFNESAYRKEYAAFNRGRLYEKSKACQDGVNNVLDSNKELVKNRDYLNLINQEVRDLSRIESLRDLITEGVKALNCVKPVVSNCVYRSKNTNRSGILVISDWHFGIEINNYLNIFNEIVFRERLQSLVFQTIQKIKELKLEKVYVINLNDLISGIIHSTIRLQNRQDLIKQIMTVSEALADVLIKLNEYASIEYYSVIDNHSRVIPNKKESLDQENFSILIDWFLKARLEGLDIVINESSLDSDICSFNIYKWSYLGVHGDKDKVSDVVQNMSLMTKSFYNVILTSHRHHFASDETHSTYVVSNGCLSGVDGHSKNLRKSSCPSQNLIIVSDNDCMESICVLKLGDISVE